MVVGSILTLCFYFFFFKNAMLLFLDDLFTYANTSRWSKSFFDKLGGNTDFLDDAKVVYVRDYIPSR